jgi:hypothetical protein
VRTLPDIARATAKDIAEIVRLAPCWILGHKPVRGPLKRSPNTVYTHWIETHCSRCGELLSSHRLYIDALSYPEYYREGYENLPPDPVSRKVQEGDST